MFNQVYAFFSCRNGAVVVTRRKFREDLEKWCQQTRSRLWQRSLAAAKSSEERFEHRDPPALVHLLLPEPHQWEAPIITLYASIAAFRRRWAVCVCVCSHARVRGGMGMERGMPSEASVLVAERSEEAKPMWRSRHSAQHLWRQCGRRCAAGSKEEGAAAYRRRPERRMEGGPLPGSRNGSW